MARILMQNSYEDSDDWYEQIEPSTLYEIEFESQIAVHATSVYPNYFVIPFKKSVRAWNSRTGQDEGVTPDLAFIAKDYQEWWVVEVEMGYHSLKNHVIPQVSKLVNADYTADVAIYLAKQSCDLDSDNVQSLIKNSDTKVLVILNQFITDWTKTLKETGASVAVFEVFRGEDGREIFRANGEYPSTYTEMASDCFFHPTVPRYLAIKSPNNLDLPQNRENVTMRYNNCLTVWRRLDASGLVLLQPVNRNPLNPRKAYQIYEQNDGVLVLREKPPERKRN